MPMSLVRNRPTAELRSLVRRLGGTWSGDTAMCACPAHADKTPSLSIRQGDRGILVTCHAGCDASDVLRELSRIERLPDFRRVAIEKARSGPGDAYMAIWRAANAIEGTIAERYIRDTRGIWAPRCRRYGFCSATISSVMPASRSTPFASPTPISVLAQRA